MAKGVLTVQAARVHLAMLSRSAFRAEEQRTRKGVAVLVGHYRGVCLSRITKLSPYLTFSLAISLLPSFSETLKLTCGNFRKQ